ncbi:KPN_02809 family neutral zinc metallopeptidase [Rhodoligotrophos defluvii]|uniref:KPN_02809 family neutral zinc metallopeptidase n=1 Tax=Rhodoligotrophos defluvii TaxID=2561934 RepID=UPI0010C9402C|nr:neutral zinc metallopeptidase [Rhodoligotrophos defluvii]
MRWQDQRRSTNVDDERGAGGGLGDGSGGGMRIPVGGRGGIGLVGLVVVLGLSYFLGVDPRVLLDGMNNGSVATGPQQTTGQGTQTAGETNDQMKDFVSAVLGSTEDTWSRILPTLGVQYTDPTLVLFSGGIQSACGYAQTAMGPFYCPGDQKVYIDLSFYKELRDRLGAPGDFAQAYVIAHEVGHHVQTLLGITQKVDSLRSQLSEEQQNQLSIRVELQADCFAGVWANQANQQTHLLDQGDVEEGLNAAAAVGDDRLQEESQGYVVPESFTHGTSEQRVRWFRKGLSTGDPRQCDTFSANPL